MTERKASARLTEKVIPPGSNKGLLQSLCFAAGPHFRVLFDGDQVVVDGLSAGDDGHLGIRAGLCEHLLRRLGLFLGDVLAIKQGDELYFSDEADEDEKGKEKGYVYRPL